MSKLGILLIQLGSPKSPEVADVKSYLKQFLGDPRVVDNQSFVWKLVLNAFVLPTRSPKSAEAYRSIWTGSTFPLFKYTEGFAEKLLKQIKDDQIELEYSYILSTPNVTTQVKALKAKGCNRIRVIPMFPQFCEATTLSCKDCIDKALLEVPGIEIDFVESYHNSPAYVEGIANKINQTIKGKDIEKLIYSFHGYPIRRIRGGDPYLDHCMETAELIADRVDFPVDKMQVTFQSKFGREPWLIPGTEETIIELAKNGVKKLGIVCPAFVVDNLETEEEVGMGLREIFFEHGGKEFNLVPCLNEDDDWVEGFAKDVMLPEGLDNPTCKPVELDPPKCKLTVEDQGCCHAKTECDTCPYKGMEKYPDGELSPSDRSVLKTMFLTLFVDLIGFSIIFPLFPNMLDYYRGIEGETGLFGWLMGSIVSVTGESDSHATLALFGGALVFIYSFLQFVMAPVFGAISDRIGRRPLLLFSIAGTAFSYVLWFFSGSFLLLVVSRLVSGLMGSNITTATAAVADITTEKTRSRGMALIGIAFGLGFILGPAIGGISTVMFDLSKIGDLASYGVNPFSAPALIAFGLSTWNFIFVFRKFKETLPPEKRGQGENYRTINPFKIFKIESYPGVSAVVWSNFFFLSAFGAAEMMLTFLTFDRLGYGPEKNGMLFVFIGFVLAMVQGGYVRRKANDVGEGKVATRGLLILIPGLFLIGIAGHFSSLAILLVGLFFMATGSAMAIPCMTALVSLYAPAEDQGRVIGVFRSMGALARTVGPMLGGILYWKFGYTSPYTVSAIILIIPFIMMKSLPLVKKDSTH